MKRCPRCEKTYPDSERFCETDGTALVSAGPAGRVTGPTGTIRCPQCGGRLEPGESTCNLCGASLERAPSAPESTAPRASDATQRRAAVSRPLTNAPTESSGAARRAASIVGYIIAAIIALVIGAWLALHLSEHTTAPAPVANASPAAAPTAAVLAQPQVALANTIGVGVAAQGAGTGARNTAGVTQVFSNNKSTLLDAYKRALAGDSTIHDGMIVTATVKPDGTVGAASIKVSTTPNPGLDADVVKSVMEWKYPAAPGGDTVVSYPAIFSRNDSESAATAAALRTRMATVSPTEPAEYAAVAAPSATPAQVAMPTAAPTPAMVRRERERNLARELRAKAKPAAPKPSLQQMVQQRIRSNRNLRRVNIYTDGHGTVTLYGRVFDDKSRLLAERTARSVPGVTSVVDTLTTDLGTWADEANQVNQRLANAGLGKVTVRIIGNDAYLSGEVATKLERARAVTITESAAPVKVQSNIITIAPGSVF